MDFEPIDDNTIDNIEQESEMTLAEHLAAQKALREELMNADIDLEDSTDEVRIKARKFALLYLPMALKKIATLAETADKDSTQLAAARTIWNIASATSTRDDVDPIAALFKELEKSAS